MTERELDIQRLAPDHLFFAPELKRLDSFLGEWKTEWQILGDGQPRVFHGTDIYEWMPDGRSLSHYTYVRMDDRDYHVMQIIGPYDATSQTYPTHSYDTKGQAMSLRGRVDDAGVWIFISDTQCVRLNVSKDGSSMTAYWEQLREDGRWHHWRDIQYIRET